VSSFQVHFADHDILTPGVCSTPPRSGSDPWTAGSRDDHPCLLLHDRLCDLVSRAELARLETGPELVEDRKSRRVLEGETGREWFAKFFWQEGKAGFFRLGEVSDPELELGIKPRLYAAPDVFVISSMALAAT